MASSENLVTNATVHMSNCDIWVAVTDQIAFLLSILSQPLGERAANPSSWI